MLMRIAVMGSFAMETEIVSTLGLQNMLEYPLFAYVD
jgi:hypothetical protein